MSIRRNTVLGFLTITLLSGFLLGGTRSPGPYSGIVIFDRWDGCYLYSGTYLMAISEGIKERLRPDAQKFVRIDVKDVIQPINPGDGLIKSFDKLPFKPEDAAEAKVLRNLEFKVALDSPDAGKPRVRVAISNSGQELVKVNLEEVAPTVFQKHQQRPVSGWRVSDGPSDAVVTRFNLGITKKYGDTDYVEDREIEVDEKRSPDTSIVELPPGTTKEVVLKLSLPPGEYDMVVGYGGDVHEKILAVSNMLAFDIDSSGRAIEVLNVVRTGQRPSNR